MSLPIIQSRAARLAARRDMTPAQLRFEHDRALKSWTNIGLGLAVVIGIAVVVSHGGNESTGIAAFGAALGLGGILGFLFGVPSVTNAPVNINNAASVAVGTGNDSSTIGGAFDGADKQTGISPIGDNDRFRQYAANWAAQSWIATNGVIGHAGSFGT